MRDAPARGAGRDANLSAAFQVGDAAGAASARSFNSSSPRAAIPIWRTFQEAPMTDMFLTRVLGDAAPEGQRPAWANHPAFAGVSLSERVAASDTDGAFRTLVVRLAPGALMATHRHPTQVEQHLVLGGDGGFTLDGVERPYRAGDLQVIAKNAEHSVRAGAGGLVLLALFSPAGG
jgi:quercetin dioxygenase-like cupin family protein